MKNNKSKDIIKQNHLDLSSMEGTVAQVLEANWQIIFDAFNHEGCSTEEFKQICVNVLLNAKQTPARDRIMNALSKKKTKYDVLIYLTNVNLKGAGLGV